MILLHSSLSRRTISGTTRKNRTTISQARAKDVSEVLDSRYVPINTSDVGQFEKS